MIEKSSFMWNEIRNEKAVDRCQMIYPFRSELERPKTENGYEVSESKMQIDDEKDIVTICYTLYLISHLNFNDACGRPTIGPIL